MTDALRTVGVTFLNIGTHHIVLADDGESATGVVYCKAETRRRSRQRAVDQPRHPVRRLQRRDGRWYFGANRAFPLYGAELEHNPLDQPDADWPARQTGRGTSAGPRQLAGVLRRLTPRSRFAQPLRCVVVSVWRRAASRVAKTAASVRVRILSFRSIALT